MTYKEAVLAALFKGWTDIIKMDAVHGNGFKITAYGLKLIGGYVLWYCLRLAIAFTAPVSAFVVMKTHKANIRYQRDIERRMNELH